MAAINDADLVGAEARTAQMLVQLLCTMLLSSGAINPVQFREGADALLFSLESGPQEPRLVAAGALMATMLRGLDPLVDTMIERSRQDQT